MIYTLSLDPSRTVRAVRLGRQFAYEINRDLGLDRGSGWYDDGVSLEPNRRDLLLGYAVISAHWQVPLDGRRTRVPHGYWLVRGPSGRLYVCDHETFQNHYSAATETTPKVAA
ncbi:hypothetical protein [Rhodococcoides fascians]|uniref:hypothetical protein n=1 Tax=Rhodococcoides fascians TaxID=1828 RepID=UPI00050C14DC|nr:hypothetical protein [Rhodococcus fascians]